jgi:hypothetical protein
MTAATERPGPGTSGAVAAENGRSEIERFVRGALGCACPDAVFRAISIEKGVRTASTPPFVRLVVGNRLLIYLLEPAPGRDIVVDATALAAAGRAERDARGLNRFRLVLASETPPGPASDLVATFDRGAAADDRAHLHLVAPESIPGVLRAR